MRLPGMQRFARLTSNRATLLLTHSPSQQLNQQRLETYLSAIAHPSFDIADRLSASHSQDRFARRPSAASGANTPRDLNSQIKLLELYTLHVLPCNGEWEYAREFIMMSEVLDDERKEAFLQALHGLKEDMENSARRERELQKRQKEELEEQRRAQVEEERRRAEDDARRKATPGRPPDALPHHQTHHRSTPSASARARATAGSTISSTSVRSSDSTTHHRPSRAIPPSSSSPKKSNGNANGSISSHPHSTSPQSKSSPTSRAKNQPVGSKKQPSLTLYRRAAVMLASLQSLVLHLRHSVVTRSPMALMRIFLFLVMFALAFGSKAVRERVRRMLNTAWEKVGATVGMGTKVSYI